MERERREREALEQSERTRLKARGGEAQHGALERGAGRRPGGRSSIPPSVPRSPRVNIGSMSSVRRACFRSE